MLLVVSLDSESHVWLEEHIGSGRLPNLAALARSSAKLPFDAALLAGLAYPTLYSGSLPSDLGLYFPVQWSAEHQRAIPWGQVDTEPSIFEQIDRTGKRIVALDPPECVPVQLRHSFCMSGLQFRARVLLHDWSSDEKRAKALLARIGPAPRADEVFGQPTVGNLEHVRRALVGAPARLEAAAVHVLQEDPPDCLWLNCCALHVGSHQFFNLATLGDLPAQERLKQTRLDIAQGYDRMLGSVMARLPAGSQVLVFFGKGMRECYGWPDLIPEMVRRILGESDGAPDVTRLRSLIPQSLRRWVADRMSDTHALELMAKLWSPRADWTRTRAVCLPSDCPGFLRLNLRGREALGCVPESAREGVLEELRDGLMTFTDLDGEPCVRSVVTPEELLGPGVHIDRFPDLVVLWNSKSTLLGKGVRSSRFGEIRRQGAGTGRSGQHGPGAFAFVSSGAHRVAELNRNVRCEDVPATILAHLGLSGIPTKGQSLLTQ